MVLVVISESSAGEELQKLQQISVPLQPSSSTGQLTHSCCPFRTRCSDVNHCIRARLLIVMWAASMAMAHGNAAIACSNGSENDALIQTQKSDFNSKLAADCERQKTGYVWICQGEDVG